MFSDVVLFGFRMCFGLLNLGHPGFSDFCIKLGSGVWISGLFDFWVLGFSELETRFGSSGLLEFLFLDIWNLEFWNLVV